MLGNPQIAYVLHLRPYTDSRVLIDFFAETSGVIRAVGRVPGKRHKGLYQGFQRLHLEYWGSDSLKTLRSCETAGNATVLLGEALFCGIYINELLQRLLPPEEPFPELFLSYEAAVSHLTQSKSRSERESILRHFEFLLLEYLGFAITFDLCADTEVEVRPDGLYYFEAGAGMHEYSAASATRDADLIRGEQLLAMARREFTSREVLQSAKKISREALRQVLGPKPLKSKELFR